MQCTRSAPRSVCGAHNAFRPALALRAAFTTTSQRHEGFNRTVRMKGPRGFGTEGTFTVHRKSDADKLHDDAFLKSAAAALLRHEAWLRHKGNRLGKMEWTRHTHLLREITNRLVGKNCRITFLNLPEDQRQAILRGLDYKGKNIDPRSSDVDIRVPAPWAVPRDVKANTKYPKRLLDMELQDFAKYMQLSPMEKVARQAVFEETTALVREILPPWTGIESFGSEKTGLATPLSDIDISLWPTTGADNKLLGLRRQMSHLVNVLYKSNRYGLVVARDGTYPLINCQHMESGIQIQIVASRGATPQQEAVAKYLAAIPNLRDLFPVVRTFFEMRGFSDTFSGGIGSYGQFVMLVAAICRDNPREPAQRPQTLAGHFLRFLYFYDGFDSTKTGISVFPRTKFRKHDPSPEIRSYVRAANRRGDPIRAGQWAMCKRKEFEPYLLCIQDPAKPDNDIGKRSSASRHILETLHCARIQLRQTLRVDDQWRNVESVLEPIVGRCHEVYRSRREQMEEYGVKVAREATEKEAGRERKEAELTKQRQERQAEGAKGEVESAEFHQQMAAGADNDGEGEEAPPRRGQASSAESL